MKKKMITLCEGGDKERRIPAGQVVIPDMWHVAMRSMKNDMLPEDKDLILECWHLAHDLLRHIQMNG